MSSLEMDWNKHVVDTSDEHVGCPPLPAVVILDVALVD